jgi:hypothetical protein
VPFRAAEPAAKKITKCGSGSRSRPHFFTSPLVCDAVFLLAFNAICWTGALGWKAFRSSGVRSQRFWLLIVFGELFAMQEFYRNGGKAPDRTIKGNTSQYFSFSLTFSSRYPTLDSAIDRQEGPKIRHVLSQRDVGHRIRSRSCPFPKSLYKGLPHSKKGLLPLSPLPR